MHVICRKLFDQPQPFFDMNLISIQNFCDVTSSSDLRPILNIFTTNSVQHKPKDYQRFKNEICRKLKPLFVVVPIVFVLHQWRYFLELPCVRKLVRILHQNFGTFWSVSFYQIIYCEGIYFKSGRE